MGWCMQMQYNRMQGASTTTALEQQQPLPTCRHFQLLVPPHRLGRLAAQRQRARQVQLEGCGMGEGTGVEERTGLRR